MSHLISSVLYPATLSRRSFLALAGAGVAGLAAPAAQSQKSKYPVIGFIKPFQNLEFARIAEIARELGWDGVEIPVRKGGTIEPERAPDELPKLAAALRRAEVELSVIATDVEDPSDPLAEKVLKTARQLNVPRYRTKHSRYDLSKAIAPQVDRFKAMFRDLARLNQEIGIQGGVQNHSGANYVGAPVWDLWHMLREVNPKQLGIYFDIAHATIEGGLSWPLEAKLVEPHLVMVSVKDFFWIKPQKGQPKGQPEWCPIGEGMVNLDFFRTLKQSSFSAPISMHFEYPLGESQAQMIAALKKDTESLRRCLA